MVECAGRCETPRADIDRAPMPETCRHVHERVCSFVLTFQWFHSVPWFRGHGLGGRGGVCI